METLGTQNSLSRGLAGFVVLTACVLSMLSWREESRLASVPTDPTMETLSATLGERIGLQDAVMVRPAWNEALWHQLGELLPVQSDAQPYDALIRGDRIDPLELLRYKSVWVVGSLGREAALPEVFVDSSRPTETLQLGESLEVTRYPLRTLKINGRLSDTLATVRVSRGGHACPWSRGAHRCKEKAWSNVRLESRDVFHRDVRWVRLQPGAKGEIAALTWSEAPSGGAVVVRVGFTQLAVRRKEGSPTLVRIFVDDKVAGELTLAPHRYATYHRVIDLDPTRSHTLRFEVSAEDHGYRQLMLQADILDVVPDLLRQADIFELR